MLLQGLFTPLTSPFKRDGSLYLRKLEHNIRRYSLGPVAGLVALAPGGETGTLTDREAAETLQRVSASATKEKVLIAGIERASVHAALERATEAFAAGFDAILLAPPNDWVRLVRGGDVRELLLFYQCIADASPLPVVLWSSTEAGSLQLPVGAIAELARHSNVIGLLDADLTRERLGSVLEDTAQVRREVAVTPIFEAVTRRMLATAAEEMVSPQALVNIGAASPANVKAPARPAVKTRTKIVGFQVLSAGPAQSMLPWLEAGATGVMPRLSACAPQGCFEVYAAWKDGDRALAAERGARLKAAEALIAELGPAGLKHGCDLNAYFGGSPRLPRISLTADQRTRVEQALGEVRN